VLSIQPQIPELLNREQNGMEISQASSWENRKLLKLPRYKSKSGIFQSFFSKFGFTSQGCPLGQQLWKNLFHLPLQFPEIQSGIFDRIESAEVLLDFSSLQ